MKRPIAAVIMTMPPVAVERGRRAILERALGWNLLRNDRALSSLMPGKAGDGAGGHEDLERGQLGVVFDI